MCPIFWCSCTIDMYMHGILDFSTHAVSNKQRSSLQRSLTTDQKKISKLVTQYQVLSQQIGEEPPVQQKSITNTVQRGSRDIMGIRIMRGFLYSPGNNRLGDVVVDGLY